MPSEDDYEKRLAARVAQWTAKHTEQAETMRADVQRRNGIIRRPDAGGLVAMMLDRLYVEDVRKLAKWPSYREWAKQSA